MFSARKNTSSIDDILMALFRSAFTASRGGNRCSINKDKSSLLEGVKFLSVKRNRNMARNFTLIFNDKIVPIIPKQTYPGRLCFQLSLGFVILQSERVQ